MAGAMTTAPRLPSGGDGGHAVVALPDATSPQLVRRAPSPGHTTAATPTERPASVSERRAKAAASRLLSAVLVPDRSSSKLKMRVDSDADTRSSLAQLGQSFTAWYEQHILVGFRVTPTSSTSWTTGKHGWTANSLGSFRSTADALRMMIMGRF